MQNKNNIRQHSSLCVLVLVSLTFAPFYATIPPSNSQSKIVKFLPGFSGILPFKLHTGYIGVGKGEEVQLFYYFVESEQDPESDPLMLWLTGGPGCSSLSAIFFEHIGPLSFNYTGQHFNGRTSIWETDLPPLQYNPYTWTKFANILFLELPVGTGFSYATTAESYNTVDILASEQTYDFLQKWFVLHPQYATNPFYVGGSSFTGLTVPIITQDIVTGNANEPRYHINIKGYVLGSPVTDLDDTEESGRIDYVHRVSLISDELYELTKANCGSPDWNFSGAECKKNSDSVTALWLPLFNEHVLEPECNYTNPKNWCRKKHDSIVNNWANNPLVQQALHVREGTVGLWNRCNYTLQKETYNITIRNSIVYHQNLAKMPLRALVYSGDQELTATYVGTLRWIHRLGVSIYDHWKPWIVNHQTAGYVTEFSNGHYNLTFTTVKGGGHGATEYYPQECSVFLEKWFARRPL